MRHQPLLLDRPLILQFILAVLLPAAFGVLTGYILGVDETAYLVLSLLGVVGGIVAGFDHLGSDQGFVRGICGGLLFGVGIIAAHSAFDQVAKAKIPDPQWILVIFTTLLGGIFGAIGGGMRARSAAKDAETTA